MAGIQVVLTWLLAVGVYTSRLAPPVLPLVVRNPYFSVWMQHARDTPWSYWPIFWNGQEVGMSIMASVRESGTVYPLFGRPHDSLELNATNSRHLAYAHYNGVQFDVSSTNFTFRIPAPSIEHDPLSLTISFQSPITPTSTLRQSIPASYVLITAEGSFDVDVYMDLNGLWASGNLQSEIAWLMSETTLGRDASLRHLRLMKTHQQRFVEHEQRGEWGSLYFTAPTDANFSCGGAATLRRQFAYNGSLTNGIDSRQPRRVMDDEPVVAFQKSFQLSSSTSKGQILFAIAHLQDEVVQFASARGLTLMIPFWKSFFFTDFDLLAFHYFDFYNAKTLAQNFSDQIRIDAKKADSDEYHDILALSARQVMGATVFSGTPENPLLLLKEISSNGNTQTVDVIFPAAPFFLYANPRWLGYLLEPLLEHQLSGQYPNKYCMHDLGWHYPNFTGHPAGNDEYMPVEESGNMLIMGLAIVNALQDEPNSSVEGSGSEDDVLPNQESSPLAVRNPVSKDTMFGIDEYKPHAAKQAKKWIKRNFKLWQQWTEYLIEFSLEPENQLSTDDFAGWLPLQSNLALKGIIGINAMSKLADAIGYDTDSKRYRNISETYVKKWQEFALSREKSYVKLAYNWYGGWITLYSLFADALLCFHSGNHPAPPTNKNQIPLHRAKSTYFIPSSIYVNQSRWYANVLQTHGLPLDSRHLYSKTDWALQAAAVAEPRVRRQIIHGVAKWLNASQTLRAPFSDIIATEGTGFGGGITFRARPVVGGHFAALALQGACAGDALGDLPALFAREDTN